MQKHSILVTGGAGYIGSHIVKQLVKAGEHVVVLDNLSTGHAENVQNAELVIGNCGDQILVENILRQHNIDSVIHLAASIIVPESVEKPLQYYQNNINNTVNLLNSCVNASVKHFIFSSSAAVYGIPKQPFVDETTPCHPINPYGRTKLMIEEILQDVSKVTALRHVSLRYFNVGGADPDGKIGSRNPAATTLIKVATQVALNIRPHLEIFGNDYPTVDGTGVRDYIHVTDIANAHLQALAYLRHNKPSITLNCGYGHGYSVRQVIDAIERITQAKLNIKERERRPGDPTEVIADATKIRTVLGWTPKYDNLDVIIQTSLDWERKLLNANHR